MLLADLPPEILIKLAHYLPLEDKVSCSLVCKSWTQVFQDSMHSDLFINSQDSLHDAVGLRQNHPRKYKETRHFVRYIHIDKSIHTTSNELCALQNNFRNVKYLYLTARCLTSINLESNTGWHHWKSLRELYICVDDLPQFFTEKFVIEILSFLSKLEKLDLAKEHNYISSISFSLDDFEAIHSYLPYLTDLGLSLNRLTLSDTDLKRMIKVSPATKMESFKLESRETDNRWLCYFACKYPNLRTFDFCSRPVKNEAENSNFTMSDQMIG